MASKNRMVLSAFNDQFSEFVDDLLTIFPNNKDVLAAKTSLGYLRKLNPVIIISFWKGYIIPRYAAQIEEGDCDFFLKKDYSLDVGQLTDNATSSEIISAINRIRTPLSELSPTSLNMCVRYLQNFTKLAMLYEG
jgi:hypothetical protein